MRTSKNLLKGLVCAIAAAAAINTAQAQIVAYDNSSDPVEGRFSPADNSLEFGDQVTLVGDANVVTEFRLEYYSSEAVGNGVIRFHANDGASVGGVPSPGSVLFESSPFNLAADFNTVEVTGISVPLSDDFFTFTIEFNDLLGTQDVGLLLRNPPLIGSSFDDIWVRDSSGDWALQQIQFSTANFAAQVVAVPEPGTVALALMGIGSLFGFGYMRRRK